MSKEGDMNRFKAYSDIEIQVLMDALWFLELENEPNLQYRDAAYYLRDECYEEYRKLANGEKRKVSNGVK